MMKYLTMASVVALSMGFATPATAVVGNNGGGQGGCGVGQTTNGCGTSTGGDGGSAIVGDITNINAIDNSNSIINNVKNDIDNVNTNLNNIKNDVTNTNVNTNANVNSNENNNVNFNTSKSNSTSSSVSNSNSVSDATSSSTSSARTGDSSSNQSQSSENNVTVEGDDYKRNPVSTAFAAPLTTSTDTCMGSSSAGAQGIGFGLSIGSTWTDKNCVRLKNARQLQSMGLNDAAIQLMCLNKDIAQAMATAGTPCTSFRKEDEVQ